MYVPVTTVWSLALLISSVLAVEPLVNLGYSRYEGTAQPNGITSWLGMRFAAPPLGDLRFAAPADPASTTGILPAYENGLICLATAGFPTDNSTSEDCLFLSVYAPTSAETTSKFPVYLFIQGGGFNINTNANYNGAGLIMAAGMNIVVVNFNYRVGLYGFLASEEVAANGAINAGILDQRKALEWVQQYIHLFGGDPDHVTLGGDSAGGASILFHLTAYGGLDQGLFHAAAAESATFGLMLTVEESQYQYDALAERVGCSTAADSLACLRAINVTYLQENNYNIPEPGSAPGALAPIYMYGPTIDGELIPDYTDRLLAEGMFIKVPVIFGDVTNGGTPFTPKNTSSYADMDLFLQDQYPALTAEDILVLNAVYPESDQFNGTGAYWRSVSNAYGEMRYMCPGLMTSSAFSNYSTAGSWNYRYNVMDPTQMAEGYGVPHTAELTAIWGPEYITTAPLMGIPDYYNVASYYTTNAAIIPVIQGYWTSFILSYDPNTYALPGAPVWEEWDAVVQGRLMFETNATAMETVVQDQAARCAYLASIGLSVGE